MLPRTTRRRRPTDLWLVEVVQGGGAGRGWGSSIPCCAATFPQRLKRLLCSLLWCCWLSSMWCSCFCWPSSRAPTSTNTYTSVLPWKWLNPRAGLLKTVALTLLLTRGTLEFRWIQKYIIKAQEQESQRTGRWVKASLFGFKEIVLKRTVFLA